MKKTFLKYALLLFIVAGIVYGSMSTGFGGSQVQRQQDSLRFGDSTTTFDLGGGVTDFWLTIQDSANSKTDSLRAYVKTGVQTTVGIMYSIVALHELSQTTSTTDIALLIPGDGVTSTYRFHSDIPIYSLYVVRANRGGVDPAIGYPYKTPVALTYND